MHPLISQLYANMLATSWIEVVAVVFGILSVWYARKENIWVYPTGIINVLIYVYLCYTAGLYADMGIQLFYFVMSVYGWYNWSHRDQNDKHVPITKLSSSGWMFYLFVMTISYFGIYFILSRYTNSTVPVFDSFTTSLFIVGMWLMAIKKIENWLAWIVGDFLVIPLFAYKGLVFTGVQYIVFLIIAVMGYMEWKRRLHKIAAHD